MILPEGDFASGSDATRHDVMQMPTKANQRLNSELLDCSEPITRRRLDGVSFQFVGCLQAFQWFCQLV
jgi:hypothetical protein